MTNGHTPVDLIGREYREHLDVSDDAAEPATWIFGFGPGTAYDIARVIAEGDLLLTRVAGGSVVEHWDVVAPVGSRIPEAVGSPA